MSKSRSGTPRRVAAGLLAGALAVFGMALAPQAGATTNATGDRIAGTNRYGTAGAIAGQTKFAGATTAILATGQNFPDALAASGVAGQNHPAPIVLTESNNYTKEAKDALKALTSLKNVIIVGGTAAVSDTVKAAVAADGYTVTRLAGTDRYGTAAAIANAIGAANVGSVGGKKTAIIASGENFPDALSGGPAGYANKMPILLVHPGAVPAETSQALKDLAIKHVIVLGGTAAVADSTKTAIDGITGGDSERLAGVNRYGTAVAVAKYETSTLASLGFDGTGLLLANGENFPDALAGGPLGGDPKPIVLGTPTALPAETNTYCDDSSPKLNKITALGGTAAIADTVLTACVTAAKNTTNDNAGANKTATTRPELVTASIVETRTQAASTATRPPGTYVMYCYDEPITGAAINTALNHLYNADGGRFTASAGSAPAGQTYTSGVTTADNKCEEVIYPVLNTAALASQLTLATVERGAATGSAGDTNIEGSAPLAPASSAPAAAGITTAPDLLSVGNFRAGSSAEVTAVDFTFDEVAYAQAVGGGAANGYHLVGIDGTRLDCTGPGIASGNSTPSGAAAPGGDGTTVFTVSCAEPTTGPTVGAGHLASTDIARGTVDAGVVGDATGGGNTNPLEAADVSNSGNSSAPDLVSIVFAPDASVGSDVVAFVYDQAVLGTVTQGSHAIYTSGGATNNAAFCARSTDNNSIIGCGFADNTLSQATYVGGNVLAGAVTGADTLAQPNQADEVGATPSAGPTTGAGLTDGPDLTGVAINTTTSAFGTPVYSATYTFDESTSNNAVQSPTAPTVAGTTPANGAANSPEGVYLSALHLYTSDGIRLDCTSLSNGAGDTQDDAVLAARDTTTNKTVTCTTYAVGG
ncbi:MAG: hypothetical protein QOI47_1658, partial [Actinomycetota bacterium]|nr:hypothetical protein [Actinomycetota bacterium]